MGYQWVEDPDDDDGADNGTQPPAELPKAARAHMRKVERERDELKALVTEFKASQRKSSVSDVVKAKGFDPKIADLIPTDMDGADAIGKWLDDRSGLFAKAQVENEPEVDDALDPETVAAMGALARVSATATSPSKPADLMAKLTDANLTKEGLDALIRQSGGRS